MSSVSDELQGKPIKLPGLKEIFPALSPPTSQPTQNDSNTLPGVREIFPELFEDDDDESSQPNQGVVATGTNAPPTTMAPATPAPQQEEDHLEPLSVASGPLTTGIDPVGNNTTTVPSNSGHEHDADKARPHSVPDQVPGATEVPSQVGQALQETGNVQQKVDVKGKGKERARDEGVPEDVPHGGFPNGEEVRDERRQETLEREQKQQNALEEDEEQRQHEEDEKLKHGNEYEVYVRTLNERKNLKEKAEAEAREDRLREMEKAGTLPWQQEKHQTGFKGLPTAGRDSRRASHLGDGPSKYRGSLPPLGPYGGYNAGQNRWDKGKHRRGKLPGIKTQAPFQNPFRDKSKTTWNQNFPDGRVPDLGKWGMTSAKPVMKVVPDGALDPVQVDNDATPGPSAAPGSRTTNNGRATGEPNHRIKKPRTAPAAQPTIVDQLPVGPPRMARPQDATTEQLRQHARELRATINEMLIIYDRIGERMEANREAGQTKNDAESKQRRSIMGKVSTLEKRNEIIRVTLEARGEQMPN